LLRIEKGKQQNKHEARGSDMIARSCASASNTP
jgi:hypothetical protein